MLECLSQSRQFTSHVLRRNKEIEYDVANGCLLWALYYKTLEDRYESICT